jgi:hypothetical protein
MIPKNKIATKGGYMKKLSEIFPAINNEKDLCPPQVGQSIPNNCLNAQGNIIFQK